MFNCFFFCRYCLTFSEATNSRALVTVTADYVEVRRLRTSFSNIYQILTQNVNDNASELDLERLDRISHELANRNACHWLYKTKQHNKQSLEDVNRRVSNPSQGTQWSEISNLNNYRVNLDTVSGFSSLPRNYTYNVKGILIVKTSKLNHIVFKTISFKKCHLILN